MEVQNNNPIDQSSDHLLNLVCPACSTENNLEYGHHINCNGCEKTFAGHTYKKYKKPFVTAKVALFIGAFGAYKIDKELLEPHRYSTGVIFEIVNSCANPTTYFSHREQQKLAKDCICALEQTMIEVPESELSSNAKLFKTKFNSNLKNCR